MLFGKSSNKFKGLLTSAILEVFVLHYLRADEDKLFSAGAPDLSKQICKFDKCLDRVFALLFISLEHLNDDIKHVSHHRCILKDLVLVFKHREEFGHGLKNGGSNTRLRILKTLTEHRHEVGLVLFELLHWQVEFTEKLKHVHSDLLALNNSGGLRVRFLEGQLR